MSAATFTHILISLSRCSDYDPDSKYYKLNELVSVRINEDYFRQANNHVYTLTPDNTMDIGEEDEAVGDDEVGEDRAYLNDCIFTSTPELKCKRPTYQSHQHFKYI